MAARIAALSAIVLLFVGSVMWDTDRAHHTAQRFASSDTTSTLIVGGTGALFPSGQRFLYFKCTTTSKTLSDSLFIQYTSSRRTAMADTIVLPLGQPLVLAMGREVDTLRVIAWGLSGAVNTLYVSEVTN